MKNKKLIFLFCFFLFAQLALSQSTEDENLYIEKLAKYTDSNNDSLLFYAKKLKNSTNLCNYFLAVNKEAKAHYQLGNVALAKQNTLQVIDNIDEEKLECLKKEKITAYNRLFWIYKNENKFQDAFKVLLKRKKIVQSLATTNVYYYANLYSIDKQLALIKLSLGFDEEGREILKEIIPKLPKVYQSIDNDNYFLNLNLSSIHNIIGESYLKTSKKNVKGHLDSASVYFKKAFEITKRFKPQHKNSEPIYQLREAEVLIALQQYDKAIDLINRSEKNKIEYKTTQKINCLKAIAYNKLNKPVVHFDKILSIRVNFTIEMSKICMENKNFNIKKVLDTIFRSSKSLELTLCDEINS